MAIQTDNPVAQLELQKDNTAILRSIGNANINYQVHGFEDLQFTLNMGYDILSSKEDKDVPNLAGMMYTSNMKDGTGLAYDGKQEKKNTLLDFYGTYTPTWVKSTVSISWEDTDGSISGENTIRLPFLRKEKNCSLRHTMKLNITCCHCMAV